MTRNYFVGIRTKTFNEKSVLINCLTRCENECGNKPNSANGTKIIFGDFINHGDIGVGTSSAFSH